MKEFDRFSFPRNYSGKVPLFFRKFPEKFRRKFPEISELTTLPVALCPPSISDKSITGKAIFFESDWAPRTPGSARLGLGTCPLPKQQPEPLPLQRSLAQEPLQVVFQFQETEPKPVLQPTPLQEPVADLGFLNGGKVPKARGSRRHRRRGVLGLVGAVPLPRNS